MFDVRQMSADDFPFATELANTMDWNMAVEDFEFSSWLDPFGCFVAVHGSQRIGIATCVSYGKVGWFGNLVVKAEFRGQGVGSQLVKHAVDYLQNKGVETIGLYAYRNLLGFYDNLGFKCGEDFSVLKINSLGTFNYEKNPKIVNEIIGEIEQFDAEFFGANRSRLLESIIFEKGNLSYYASNSNGILGYVASTVYDKMAWVGPLVFRKGYSDLAAPLVKAVLAKLSGQMIYMVPSKKETVLLNMLLSLGFEEDFSVSRLFLGQPVANNCIYMPESLERG